jgi:Xaa-Pro aminopeptidase
MELAGSRAAHLRDGVAMLRFLRFIEASAPGSLTEIDAAKRLEQLRSETAAEGDMPLTDLSFESISSTARTVRSTITASPSAPTARWRTAISI